MLRRALGLGVALGLLAGCGSNLHPGAAANVNGSVLSQSEVDDIVGAACRYITLQNQASTTPQQFSVSQLRATVTSSLISFDLLDGAVDDLGLTIRDADVEALAAQSTLPEGLSSSDSALLDEFFTDAAQSEVTQETVGAHLKDSSVTDSGDATSDDVGASTDYVKKYFGEQDVTVNPGYGTWDGTTVNQSAGSLSDPVSDAAKQALPADGQTDLSGRPAAQVCA